MRRILVAFALLALVAPMVMAQSPAQQSPYQSRSEDPNAFLVGWIGTHFNNGIGEAFESKDTKPKTMGLSLGFWARSWVSGELDFGYSKDYFGDPTLLGGNNLMTFTGSIIVGPWIHLTDNQIIRPYGFVGGGLARSKIEDFVKFGNNSRNRGVIDYGGGVMIYLVRNFGLRGDVRFMKDVGTKSDSSTGWGITETMYKRVTAGVFVAF
jgi:hypothetical protein